MNMDNMFNNIKKEEMRNIYLDYCISKENGERCESLVPYAEKIKEKFGELMSLREAIDRVSIMFLEEIAKRYFKY